MLCCGAGAAVAAIFKAPITGVVFVLEILMLDITATSVIPLLISSITATTTALMFRGFDPIISVTLSESDAFVLQQIPLYILLGVCCGVMSYYFTSVNSIIGTYVKNIKTQYRRWAFAGVVLGVLARNESLSLGTGIGTVLVVLASILIAASDLKKK